MIKEKEEETKMAEFNALFVTLNDKEQDSALIMLKSLEFAQSIISKVEKPCDLSKQSI